MKKIVKKLGVNPSKSDDKSTSKVQGSQVKAQPNGKIHPKNQYNEALHATKMSKMYEDAEHALREKPYAEQIAFWLTTVQILRWIYPLASFVLAVFAIHSYLSQATNGTGLGFYVFLMVLIGLAGLVESGKSHFSIQYFQENVQNALIGTGIFTVISIALSTYGMYELTLQEADNSTEIKTNFTVKTDSTRQIYLKQIEDLDTQIESAKEALTSRNKWLKHSAREDLENAQNQKSELLALVKNETETLEKDKEKALKTDFSKNDQNAIYLALIVFAVELLYILSIRTIAQIQRKIKTENRTFNKVETPKSVQVESPQNLTLESVAVSLLLQHLQNGENIALQAINSGFQRNPTAENTSQKTPKVGFQFVSTSPQGNSGEGSKAVKANSPQGIDYSKPVRNCKHCGKEFNYKHWNKRYCSRDCKDKAWEERTGKKLNFKQINKRKGGTK